MTAYIATAVMIAALSARAETIDRVAVVIGKEVITESAVILDLRVSAFLDQAVLDLGPTAKRKSAERLTDQILILREASDSHLAPPTDEETAALLEQVKKMFGSDAQYRAGLVKYGVTERDVVAQLRAGLAGLRFSDLRFRPTVEVSDADLHAYYDRVKPKASFEDSSADIEKILTNERTAEALDAWLKTARAEAKVQFREKVFE